MPFVVTALTALGSAFGLSAAGAATFATVTGRLLASVALSALSRALAPKQTVPGIRQSSTATGGTNPVGFVLGRYATGGQAACPAMSHGTVGKTPNAYLTYVIELSDVPGMTLESLIVDGEATTIDTIAAPHPAGYGQPLTGRFAGYAWVKYYNGSQVAADPMLLAQYATYPLRPWSAAMIGRNLCYAIVTFRYNREVFSSFPAVRFVVGGIPIYDPRKDTTVGGAGAHRWGDVATYQPSNNPMVQAYNIMRGITVPGLGVWGGDAIGVELPLPEWFAAMNACDALVSLAAGRNEPAFRSGYEVALSDEPADVLDELFKACSAQIVDMGGIWKPRVGGPGLPVYFMTDDTVIVTRAQEFDPFPGLGATYNGVTANHPDPASLWESREAPPRYNAAYEAEDGGRRVVASLALPAVPYPVQVQRLMDAYIKDERRWRRHGLTLPPSAALLEPLDTLSWTSARNGYAGKVFEMAEVGDQLVTALQQVSMRERDPADYDFTPGDEIASGTAPGGTVIPPAQTMPGFAVDPYTLLDADGDPRKAAILLYWDALELDAVQGMKFEVRVKLTGTDVAVGTFADVNQGYLIVSEGILRAVEYQARAIPIAEGRPVAFTAWLDVTAPDVGITAPDVVEGAISETRAAIRASSVVLSGIGAANRVSIGTGFSFNNEDLVVDVDGLTHTRPIKFEGSVGVLNGARAGSAITIGMEWSLIASPATWITDNQRLAIVNIPNGLYYYSADFSAICRAGYLDHIFNSDVAFIRPYLSLGVANQNNPGFTVTALNFIMTMEQIKK